MEIRPCLCHRPLKRVVLTADSGTGLSLRLRRRHGTRFEYVLVTKHAILVTSQGKHHSHIVKHIHVTDLSLGLRKKTWHKIDGLVSQGESQIELFRQSQQPIVQLRIVVGPHQRHVLVTKPAVLVTSQGEHNGIMTLPIDCYIIDL